MTGLGIKLAIRTDRATGYARAFIATMDGTQKTEIGAISLKVLDGPTGPFFQRWKELMRDAMANRHQGSDRPRREGVDWRYQPGRSEKEPQA